MSHEVCEHGSLLRKCELCERDAEIERLKHDIEASQSIALKYLNECERLRSALLFLGKAFELEDDQTDSGFTYREALGHGAQQEEAK
jgi:uncharacterized Fe-S radical SAM superfamily protein PflX